MIPNLLILAPCKNHEDRRATTMFAYGDSESLKVLYLCDECASRRGKEIVEDIDK